MEQTAPLSKGFAEVMTAISKTIPQAVTLSDRARVLTSVPHLEAVAEQWTAVLDEGGKTWCCKGLALLYDSTNRLTEAAKTMSSVVSILEEFLGPNHPNTAIAKKNLDDIQQALLQQPSQED